VTTTSIDTPDVSTCPDWCRGTDWHSSDDGVEEFHGGPSRHLHVRGVTNPPNIDPDYQGVSVYLGQRVAPDARPAISLSLRDDESGSMTWVDLTPQQATKVVEMLTAVTSAAL
jgi:hypothetical protein